MIMKNEKTPKKLELRSVGEVREVGEEGVVTAYLTKWDTVDSWRTKFEKGAFVNTFKTRGAKRTRLIWDHKELAGKIMELREDDTGPLATVKFNLETRAGQEAYSHVKAEDVTCFSFGFNTVKDRWVGGIRSIQEVDMLECGPSIFQANDNAVITDVRSTDFDETVNENELSNRGWKLRYALDETIDDIFWGSYEVGGGTPDEIATLVDTAISKFHTAYMSWLAEYYNQFETRETALPPREIRNKLQGALIQMDVDSLTAQTSLTEADVDTLKTGGLLSAESRGKLKDLPEAFQKAHQEERRKKIEELSTEIRASGFSDAEKERFTALLGISEGRPTNPECVEIGTFFTGLRASLFK